MKVIKKVAQNRSMMAPSAPEQIYQTEELWSGLSKFVEIFSKIKAVLKIDSFLEIPNYFQRLYEEVIDQQDIARKTLAFMGALSKFSLKV